METDRSATEGNGKSGITPEVRAGVRRWLIKGYVGVLMTAATVFIPAGRLDCTAGLCRCFYCF